MTGPALPHGQEPTPRQPGDGETTIRLPRGEDLTVRLPQDANPTVHPPQDATTTVDLSKDADPTVHPPRNATTTADLSKDADPTVRMPRDADLTVRMPGAEDPTHAPVPTEDSAVALSDHDDPPVALAPDEDSTVRLPVEGEPEPGPASKPGSASDPASASDDDYSATLLASHWVQRPAPEEDLPAAVPGGQPAPPAAASTAPDRVEGRVLRFGPGVTMADRDRSGATVLPLPAATRPRPARSPVLRRYTLPAVVLLGVLLFLAWQRFGPSVAVRDVRVSTDSRGPGCDGTADVVALLSTNGRPGTVTYRWERSDGTTSGALTEKLPRGRSTARLHLLWTFHGEGRYQARATLRILSPDTRTATTSFTYHCR